MRVTVLQHAPYEDSGYAGQYLNAAYGAQLNTVHMYQPGSQLPDVSDLDMLLICGGPMGATDDADHPWLTAEKAFIRAVIDAGKTVLGLCLGGQLIAASQGAEIRMNPTAEVGWYPLTAHHADNAFRFPPDAMVMHWHYQTFALPANARLLASSAACAHQAYQIGDRVIGLQCHPEMTADNIRYLITHFPQELTGEPGIMSYDEIDTGADLHAEKANQLMAAIIDYLVGNAGLVN